MDDVISLKDALLCRVRYKGKSNKTLKEIGETNPAYLDLLIDKTDPNEDLFPALVVVCEYFDEEIGKAVSLRCEAIKKKVCGLSNTERVPLSGSVMEPVIAIGDRVPFPSIKAAAKELCLDKDKLLKAVENSSKYSDRYWVIYSDPLADLFCKLGGVMSWTLYEASKK
jgi:hypothetical protein